MIIGEDDALEGEGWRKKSVGRKNMRLKENLARDRNMTARKWKTTFRRRKKIVMRKQEDDHREGEEEDNESEVGASRPED